MFMPTLAAACAFAGGSVLLWQRAGARATVASDAAIVAIAHSLRALPLAFGLAVQFPRVGAVFPLLACAPAALVVAREAARGGRQFLHVPAAALLVLGLACVLWLSVVRTRQSDIVVWLAWAAAVALLVVAISTVRPPLTSMLEALLTGFGWYLVATIALFVVLGLQSPSQGFRPDTATVFGMRRVLWPLSANTQVPATIAALYVVGRYGSLLPRAIPRWQSRLFLAAAIVTWALSDNRFVVIAVVVALLAARRFTPRAITRSAVVCVVLLAMPWWWSAMSSTAVHVLGDDAVAVTFVSRSDDETEILTLNNRSSVWAAGREILAGADLRHLLGGYGIEGQRTSGASALYEEHFLGFADPRAASVHNSAMQTVLDSGLVGLAVVGTAIGLAFAALRRRAAQHPDDGARLVLLRILVVLVTSAGTEAYLSASFAQLPFWLLVALLALATVDDAAPVGRPA